LSRILSPADLPVVFLFVLMVVGILLAGDDDLPGPRRAFAPRRFAENRIS
jgi:hypothetical protein